MPYFFLDAYHLFISLCPSHSLTNVSKWHVLGILYVASYASIGQAVLVAPFQTLCQGMTRYKTKFIHWRDFHGSDVKILSSSEDKKCEGVWLEFLRISNNRVRVVIRLLSTNIRLFCSSPWTSDNKAFFYKFTMLLFAYSRGLFLFYIPEKKREYSPKTVNFCLLTTMLFEFVETF